MERSALVPLTHEGRAGGGAGALTGQSDAGPRTQAQHLTVLRCYLPVRAVSDQGIEMMVDGRAAATDTDVGATLTPSGDWWTFDTCHVGNPHVQARAGRGTSGEDLFESNG